MAGVFWVGVPVIVLAWAESGFVGWAGGWLTWAPASWRLAKRPAARGRFCRERDIVDLLKK
jgi:hypothetical protein